MSILIEQSVELGLSRNASGEEKLSSEILKMLGIQQNKPNDYEDLGITSLSPTKKEIEATFRRKGLLCHPDKHPIFQHFRLQCESSPCDYSLFVSSLINESKSSRARS